jgi:hypothetical protein
MFNQNANAQMMSNQQVQANNASTFGATNNSLQHTGSSLFANNQVGNGSLFGQSTVIQNNNNLFNQPGSGQGQPAQNQGGLFSSAPPTPTTNNQPTSLFGNS